MKQKNKKGEILGMLLDPLGVSFLQNLLTRICTITAGESTIRAGQDF